MALCTVACIAYVVAYVSTTFKIPVLGAFSGTPLLTKKRWTIHNTTWVGGESIQEDCNNFVGIYK